MSVRVEFDWSTVPPSAIEDTYTKRIAAQLREKGVPVVGRFGIRTVEYGTLKMSKQRVDGKTVDVYEWEDEL